MRMYKITHALINALKYTHLRANTCKRARMQVQCILHASLNLHAHVRTRPFGYCGMRLREAG